VKSVSQQRVIELQSLRGIAAMMVMIGHSVDYFQQPEWFWSDGFKIFNGRAAVAIFFVLSGFVLTRSLAGKELNFPDVARFYISRLFRIYPAIWAASALGLVYLLCLHWQIPVLDESEGVRRQFRADRMDALHIVASLAGMLAFILPQLWSVTVEIFASFTLPIVAALAFRGAARFWVFLGAMVVVSFLLADRTYYNIGMYYMDFIVGAGLAILPSATRSFLRRNPTPSLIILIGAALLIIPSQFLPLAYYSPTANMIEAILAALIIATLTYSTAPIGLMRSRVMLFLGDISYSVYLIHYVVVCSLADLIAVAWGGRVIGGDAIAAAAILALTTTVVTLPLAWLSYTYVELPGIEVGKRFLASFRIMSRYGDIRAR
jgi:peptidoglycan/LPS O-acetylase OafA/YrhL